MNNIRDFGAKGDGITKDTASIQSAIDAGGIAYFPPGIYLSGTLYLRSNGGLELAPGAILLGSPDREDYNSDDFCSQNRVCSKEYVSGAHLIVAVEQENIILSGGGRIDGNRQAFYGEKSQPDCGKHNEKFDRNELRSVWRPAQMLFLCECNAVTIQNLQLYNAPYWTCFLHGCEDVIVSGLRILNDQRTPNGDGIDIDCCCRVTVSNCIIDSGDDCITLRGAVTPLKKERVCEYITISNLILHTNCNAFRIGVGNGIVRKAVISNCVIHHSRNGITLCSKYSADSQGVLIEDIHFENIFIESCRPLAVLTNAWGRELGPSSKTIRNISFHHLRGSGEVGSLFAGFAEGDLKNISLSDVFFDYTGGERVRTDPDMDYAADSSISAPSAFRFEYTDGVFLENCRIFWKTSHQNWKYGVETWHCSDVEFSHCRFAKKICMNGEESQLPE